ncbi:MAG TPA: extracellular solute-binding protein, partial [Pseudolysinimonas sp.]|nr:extracellular solute-binding protein [Pseudolysinimonas sp.]
MRASRFAPIGLAALLLAGCAAATPASGPSATKDPLSGTVTVLAAASLTETFDSLAASFEKRHPNVSITSSYGGSGALAQQIVAGAPVDVFASAAD